MEWIGRVMGSIFVRVARLVVWSFYSTIRVSGAERIPRSGPTLLVANHANSLVDPVVLGLAVRRRVRYLAKAPLFDLPFFGTLIRGLGMIPVWRAVDDRSQMRKNLRSLGDAAQALAEGESVGIFPEGRSHDQRTLEPIFSGTSRIILQALDAGAEELTILPVGINYGVKQLFRSSVWVQVGEPIPARQFVEAHGGHAEAKKTLNEEIGKRLRAAIIHLDDPAWETYLEDLEILDPASESPDGDELFSLRQRAVIAGALNHFRVSEPTKVESIGRALNAHRMRLEKRGLRVRSIILRQSGWRRLVGLLARSFQLVLGLVPVLCGTLHNLLPLLLERGIVRLINQTGRTTVALSRLGVGVLIFGIWYGLIAWLMSRYFLPWVAWFWAITMPFAGLYALNYFRALAVISRRWRTELRMLFNRKFLEGRRIIQARISARVHDLSTRYADLRPPVEPKHLPIYQHPLLRRVLLWGITGFTVGLLGLAGYRVGFRSYTLPALTAPAFDLGALDVQTLHAEIQADEQMLEEILTTLKNLGKTGDQTHQDFQDGTRSYLDPADVDEIHRLMLTFLNCRNELFRLVWKYRDAETIPDPPLRLRSSLLVLTSGCALYDAASKLVTMFQDDPEAQRKLNEAEGTWEIPEGIYDTIAHNLTEPKNLRALVAEHAKYKSQLGDYRSHGLMESSPQARFHQKVGAATVTGVNGPNLLVGMLEELDKIKDDTLYQGQSLVSTWIGNTRVRERKGGPRITPEHLAQMRDILKPGDILIERQDWFLSRAFMPGYWAHAAIYVGDAKTVEGLGLDTHEWVMPQGKKFGEGPFEILEAVPSGVRMTTLDHCIGVADSVAILRPRVSEREVKEAIARAFRDLGKPYDFEFDFFSGDKIVCTELVYRAFSGSLDLNLVDVLGRQTLPPTELARAFASEVGQEDRNFDLILFLDGHVVGPAARERGPRVFANTVNRPALTWLNVPQ
jgi:glycerol-3-phosphate O-acyltransferase/dihydroxyacetone phosphate acyltransferase